MGIKMQPKTLRWYVWKYEEAEANRSAIMQDFRDNGGHFLNLLVRNLSWVILVWDITFCFIFMVHLFYIFFVT